MKKLLSLLLALTVLFASLSLFSACSGGGDGGDDEGDKKGDGAGEGAGVSALASFFDLGVDFATPLEAALAGGSVTVSLAGNKSLFGEEFGGANVTIYSADGGNRAVFDAGATLAGETYGARLFADQDMNLIVKSADLFGSDAAYMLRLATLAEDLENSEFADLIELPESVLGVLSASLADMPASEKTEEEMQAFLDELVACFTPKEGTATVSVGGKDISAKTVTYAVTPATVRAAIMKTLDFAEIDAELRSEIEGSLIQGMGEGGGSLVVYTNAESGAFVKAKLQITDEWDEEVMDATLTLSDKELAFKLTEEGNGVSAKIVKSTSGNTTTFTLTAGEIEDGTEDNFISGTFAHNKADGTYTLTVDVEGETLILGGVLTATADMAKFSLTSIRMDEVTLNLDLSLTVKASASAPAAPTNAKNLLSLSVSELEALGESIASSRLGSLLEDLFGATDMREYCEWCGDESTELYGPTDESGYVRWVCPHCYELYHCDFCGVFAPYDTDRCVDEYGDEWTLCGDCYAENRCDYCGECTFGNNWQTAGMNFCHDCYDNNIGY